MAFARPKKREPVGEAELFEYAVGALSRRMRTVRDLRRLMKPRAFEGERGEADMDRVCERLVELKYLSDTRFAQDFTRLRKENQGFGRRRVAQDLAVKGVGKELVAETVAAAFDETDEVALARAYCERKRIQKPDGAEGHGAGDEPADARGVFLYGDLQAVQGLAGGGAVEGGGDSDSYAEKDEYDLPEF